MLLGRQDLALGAQQAQRADDLDPGLVRRDDRVDVPALGRDVGVGEGVLVLRDQLGTLRLRVLGVLELVPVEDVDRALGAHHGDLGGRPGDVDVGAEVLGPHHVVRPAVGLAGDDGDQRHRGLGVGVDQLRAAADDAVPLLVGAGQEAGHVHEGQHRDVERVAGAHEARGLLRRVDVEGARELHRLVGDDADRPALDPAEAHDDVRREERLDLEELLVVQHRGDDLVHVVRLVRAVRDQRVERPVEVGELEGAAAELALRVRRGLVEVVLRQEGQQRLDVLERVLLVVAHVVGVAGLGVVRPRAAELLHRDVLAGDGLDDVGPGDEHVRGAVDHDREVGDRGGVDVAAGAGAHDQADLRDDAAGVHVAAEDLAVQAERDHALLDAGAGALVDADDRAAGLDGEVHHLGDLLAVDLAQRPAEDREVLGEHAHLAAVDGAVAGHHAVAVGPLLLEAEGRRPVPRELVELDERALVEEQLDPLAGGLAPLRVLLLDRLRGARVDGLVEAPVQVGQLAGGGVDVDVLGNVGAFAGTWLCAHVSGLLGCRGPM